MYLSGFAIRTGGFAPARALPLRNLMRMKNPHDDTQFVTFQAENGVLSGNLFQICDEVESHVAIGLPYSVRQTSAAP